jgi:hypothetical protein
MPKAAFVLAVALSACAGGGPIPLTSSASVPALTVGAVTRQLTGNDIPPRLQWNANFGYCGETSMISAGLYYGQYASQYEVRQIASPGVPQSSAGSQLLLGENDMAAAKRLHLNAVEWKAPSAAPDPAGFLRWVSQNVTRGYPVAIGVYTNEYRFYGKTNPKAGDPEYDHIVPVVAASNRALTFSDNGLWAPGHKPPYLFSYPSSTFARSRAQANAHDAPVYSLAAATPDFGIAVTGVADPGHETLPVRVATNVNFEKPVMQNGTSVRPKPMPLVLTVSVSGLAPGVTYKIYRYGGFAAVPNRNFNAAASNADEVRTIRIASGSSYTFSERIESDDVAVYRAVPASGL